MAFRSLQNGSFWCPKILMSSTKIWQSLLKPTVYYKMVPYDPIFTIEWQHYRGDNPSHSMEEMNCQTIAFILEEKLQRHFVELPPCPELSSKGNFSRAIL